MKNKRLLGAFALGLAPTLALLWFLSYSADAMSPNRPTADITVFCSAL